MSSDRLSQLLQLLQLEHGQSPQILSVNGATNQLHSSQYAASSSGPNASRGFQVANSNVRQTTYNIFLGNILGAIANEDHGAYPNHQSTVNSDARPSMIEAADQEDLNAKLAAVKESTVQVRKSTEEMKESMLKLAETTYKVSEWITALNWPTFKLSLDNEAEAAFGDLMIEPYMIPVQLGQLILEFCRSSVEHGESIVRDVDSISMTTDGESISLVVFDALTSKLGEMAAMFTESLARVGKESIIGQDEFLSNLETKIDESARQLHNDGEGSRVKEFIEAIDFNTFKEISDEVTESIKKSGTPLAALCESMVAYAESLGAPDDVIAAFRPEGEEYNK